MMLEESTGESFARAASMHRVGKGTNALKQYAALNVKGKAPSTVDEMLTRRQVSIRWITVVTVTEICYLFKMVGSKFFIALALLLSEDVICYERLL